MRELTLKHAAGQYTIHIGNGLLDKLGTMVAELVTGRVAAVVTDSNVAPLYAARAQESLQNAGFTVSVIEVPAGESSKCLARLEELYQRFHDAGISRRDLVVALGGGVVGDLTGFAAATYLRGVAYVQVPTTFLAQIDSAIGGKTGVDLDFGKNLAGAIYQPKAVISDCETLASLPTECVADGMAEAVKYGCIRDLKLFEHLEQSADTDFEYVIECCAAIKRDVVQRDEHEAGERMLLNFGHTVGHAIEKALGFGGCTHGQAVAVGMIVAARMGEALGVSAPGTAERVEQVVARNCSYQNILVEGLTTINASTAVTPSEQPRALTVDTLLSGIAADKKCAGGMISFILLKEIGDAVIYPISLEDLELVLRKVTSHV